MGSAQYDEFTKLLNVGFIVQNSNVELYVI